MEDFKRVALAIALGFLISYPLLHWVSPRLFPPKPVPETTNPEQTPEVGQGPTTPHPPAEGQPPAPAPAPTPDTLPTVTRQLANDSIRAVFTTKGASLSSLSLLKYKERYLPRKDHPQGDKPLELLYEAETGHRPFLLHVREGDKEPLDDHNWTLKSQVGEEPLVFEWVGPTGLTITKSFSLSKTSPYAIDMDIEVSRKDGGRYAFDLEAQSGIAYESDGGSDIVGVVARAEIPQSGDIIKTRTISTVKDEVTVRSVKDKEVALLCKETGPGWIALANRYFIAALIPMVDGTGHFPVESMVFQKIEDHKERELIAPYYPTEAKEQLDLASKMSLLTTYRMPAADLSQGPWRCSAKMYAGPKSEEALQKMSDWGLNRALDFGIFGAVSEVLLWILAGFRSICGNWGWSILMLTLLVRACIFPLNRKAQLSAQKMSKLGPKVTELRKRFEKDKERLGREMMSLYKEHGVNPIGGCLPILLQLPVLYGLYNALQKTIALRQQPFIGWIRDLSQPDMLFPWHFAGLPCFCAGGGLMKTEFFNLLPLIMMLTWFVQSLTYPKPADPEMAKQQSMMKWMPLFFGLMMFSTPSGLILYWMTSTFLGIIEQQYIRRVLLPRS